MGSVSYNFSWKKCEERKPNHYNRPTWIRR